jgi:hypothetical protein
MASAAALLNFNFNLDFIFSPPVLVPPGEPGGLLIVACMEMRFSCVGAPGFQLVIAVLLLQLALKNFAGRAGGDRLDEYHSITSPR